MPPVQAPPVDLARVQEILARHPQDRRALIHLLQDLQEELRYLPREAVESAARHAGVPLAKAFAVATFYKAFSLAPQGETIVRICTGTACHIRGAQVLVEEAAEALGVAPGETTADLRHTLETVNCVGACALAPIVKIGERYCGNVVPGSLARLLGGAAAGTGDEAGADGEEAT